MFDRCCDTPRRRPPPSPPFRNKRGDGRQPQSTPPPAAHATIAEHCQHIPPSYAAAMLFSDARLPSPHFTPLLQLPSPPYAPSFAPFPEACQHAIDVRMLCAREEGERQYCSDAWQVIRAIRADSHPRNTPRLHAVPYFAVIILSAGYAFIRFARALPARPPLSRRLSPRRQLFPAVPGTHRRA